MSFPPTRKFERQSAVADTSFTQDVDIVDLHNHG